MIIKNIKTITAFSLLIILILLSRSYSVNSFTHLPDATIVSLLIAGIYFRHWLSPIILITLALVIDNYAVFYQGISANCITPAYSVLPVLYYLVYWCAKFVPSLSINSISQLYKTAAILLVIISAQWLLATASYYAFTTMLWSDFGVYIAKWAIVEIPNNIYWLVAIAVIINLADLISHKTHSTKTN